MDSLQKTATLLDGLAPVTIKGKTASRYVHFMGKNPAFAKHLRTWGEAGTVKIKTKPTPKINDLGVQCIMVGYALDHPGDCYRMYDPVTKRVHVTRDVIWLKRMYYQRPEPVHEININDDADSDNGFASEVPINN